VITERMDLLAWLRKQLAEADTDLLREMVRCFAETLMGAEADALCGQFVVGDRMATSV
jgi:transposase-like protein